MADDDARPRYHQDDYRARQRFDVSRAADGSYAVAALGSYPTIAAAFRAVLDAGGRIEYHYTDLMAGPNGAQICAM